MRKRTAIVLVVACLTAGWLAAAWWPGPGAAGSGAGLHTGITIEQVQALSMLVTTRVDVADVVEARLEGRTGTIKAALLVKGDFLLGTDLSRARFESIDVAASRAVLVLAQPRVASPRLDHERTKVFAVTETGLWMITPGDDHTTAVVVERAYQQAQRYISEATNDPSLAARGRQQAETVLDAFFRPLGWTVTIRWTN